MLERVNREGLDLLVPGGLEERGILVAFTGRQGGVSQGPFSSLNLSYNVGDKPRAVARNRESVSRAIGVKADRWVLCQQVHGAVVSNVGPLEVGRGTRDFASAVPRSDGLVTGVSDVAIAILSADCIPLALVARSGAAVAVAHSGWRGVLAGTAVMALKKLVAQCSISPGEVSVFIGPHIMSCCMETDAHVAAEFRRRFGDHVIRASGNGNAHIDLEAACRQQLERAGVEGKSVFSAGICTMCGEGYFSFRASSGICGRQGGFAAILDLNRDP
jgi:hypothetical protein